MAKRGRDVVGGKRSEIVTVRLDPKLKYLAELAARKQRRPLSSYIEWAVERSLAEVILREEWNEEKVAVRDAERIYNLWDLDEPDRVIRLALYFPDLLTHDEQLVWKLVRENGHVWKGRFSGSPPELVWNWEVKPESMVWDRLRQYWPIFKDVAEGIQSPSALPAWRKTKPALSAVDAPITKPGHSDPIDDDLPF
jgi:hypothetical protein